MVQFLNFSLLWLPQGANKLFWFAYFPRDNLTHAFVCGVFSNSCPARIDECLKVEHFLLPMHGIKSVRYYLGNPAAIARVHVRLI